MCIRDSFLNWNLNWFHVVFRWSSLWINWSCCCVVIFRWLLSGLHLFCIWFAPGATLPGHSFRHIELGRKGPVRPILVQLVTRSHKAKTRGHPSSQQPPTALICADLQLICIDLRWFSFDLLRFARICKLSGPSLPADNISVGFAASRYAQIWMTCCDQLNQIRLNRSWANTTPEPR